MDKTKWLVCIVALAMASSALAGGVTVPLGAPLGTALGVALGAVLGVPLGELAPIGSYGLLLVGAMALILGIVIARRKVDR
jgi:hypothetical protein